MINNMNLTHHISFDKAIIISYKVALYIIKIRPHLCMTKYLNLKLKHTQNFQKIKNQILYFNDLFCECS
jgi:hypothetical protein